VCSRAGSSTLGVVNEPEWGRHARAFAARGLLLVDIADGLGVVVATHVRLFDERGGPGGRGRLLNAVRELRRFGKPSSRQPAPTLPRALLRTLSRTERAYDRLGSIDAVARRLNTPRKLVDLRLRFARVVRSLPRVRAIDCARDWRPSLQRYLPEREPEARALAPASGTPADSPFVDEQRQSLDATRLPNAAASGASPSRGDPTDEPKQAWGAACRGQRDAIRWLGLRRFGRDLDRVVVAAGSREKLPVARDPFELVLATRPELEA